MVTIKLLSFINNIAEVDCLPDDNSDNKFTLTLDVDNQKILKNSLNQNNKYVIHAAYRIFDFWNTDGKIPEESIAAWC